MQLVLEGTAAVRWADAARPPLSDPGAAVVRPVAVATCDIGVAVLRGRYPLAGTYPFGHEAVAEVVEVGDDVRTVSPGDRVVVPFQISCGACGRCRRGRTQPVFSMYSRCGTFHTGRAHVRSAIDRVLTLVAVGVDPSIVTSDVVPWDDAVAALTDQPMKLVVARSQ